MVTGVPPTGGGAGSVAGGGDVSLHCNSSDVGKPPAAACGLEVSTC